MVVGLNYPRRIAHIDRDRHQFYQAAKSLFAFTQCRSPLKNSFLKRAIPHGQACDKQQRHRHRVTRVCEINRNSIDGATIPFLVNLLQLAGLDGCKALRHGAQRGCISFTHGSAEFVPEYWRRMPKVVLYPGFVQKIKRRWVINYKDVDFVLLRRLDDLVVILKEDQGRHPARPELVNMLVTLLDPDRKSFQ